MLNRILLFYQDVLLHLKMQDCFLPSSDCKSKVYRLYKECCQNDNMTCVSLSIFKETRKKYLPFVVRQKPRSDLCRTCHANTIASSNMANMPEDKKLEIIDRSAQHLLSVSKERNEYKRQISLTNPGNLKLEKHDVCSYNGLMHYSFDFAQQIFLPQDPQQVGALYFQVPYKLSWFGVMCKRIPKMIHFLIPESVNAGKGANAVCSYLHIFFLLFGLGETDVL